VTVVREAALGVRSDLRRLNWMVIAPVVAALAGAVFTRPVEPVAKPVAGASSKVAAPH
jgi:hypothetical protein